MDLNLVTAFVRVVEQQSFTSAAKALGLPKSSVSRRVTELEEELDEEDDEIVSLSEEEQSLEEIFREFKKGVEQQLDSEDYDTH